jgi:hypothetical protein
LAPASSLEAVASPEVSDTPASTAATLPVSLPSSGSERTAGAPEAPGANKGGIARRRTPSAHRPLLRPRGFHSACRST